MLLHQTIFKIIKWLAITLVLLFLLFSGIPFFFSYFGFDIHLGRGGGGKGEGILLRSPDEGSTWTDAGISENRTPFPIVLFALSSHPNESHTLFLGAQSSGLWRSDTGGVSWRQARDPSGVLDPRAYVHAIAHSPSDPNILYIAAFQDKRGRVLKSRDGGMRFEEVYAVSEDRFGVLDIEVDPKNSDHVFIATGEGGLLESQDGGRSWRVIQWFGEGIKDIIGRPAESDAYFVHAISGKLWKTEDSGSEWREFGSTIRDSQDSEIQIIAPADFSPFSFSLLPGREVRLIAEAPSDPKSLLAVTNKKFYHTKDNGNSWTAIAPPVSPDAEDITAFAFHPVSSDIIFAGVGSRLFRSSDSGISWETIRVPTDKTIARIFIHPRESRIMFMVLE